jgi:hypothetical protein
MRTLSIQVLKVYPLQASSDLSILDFDIPYSMAFVATGGIEVVTTVLVISTVTWQVLVVAVPVAITMVYVQVSLLCCTLMQEINFSQSIQRT